MEVMLITTMALVGGSFFAFFLYVRGQSVRGRISGTGSLKIKEPAPFGESARGLMKAFLARLRHPLRGDPLDAPEPGQATAASGRNADSSEEQGRFGGLVAPSARPEVFSTHEHLIPLAEQLAEEVWPVRSEIEDSYLKSLPYRDFSAEQARVLMPHHAAMRLFSVLDALHSVAAFRDDYREFNDMLHYQVARNCNQFDMARKISMGVQKYARNRSQIFERRGEELDSTRLAGVFWSGVFADCPDAFVHDDARNFHFAFSMACDFTSRYNFVLSLMEKHCGAKLRRAPLTIVIPSDDEKEMDDEQPAKGGEFISSLEDPQEQFSGTYHDLLDWIEDTEQYRSLYEDTMDLAGVDACYFCSGDPSAADVIVLTNGWRVHKRCHDMLVGRLRDLRTVQASRELFKASPNLLCAHRLVNTYWPGSPPDWENRLLTITARAEGECENCGETHQLLEVVHVKPPEQGGNHACDNLMALCPSCLADLRTHLENSAGEEPPRAWPSLYDMKLRQIEDAMSEGRKLLFTYRGKETRVISPREWAKRRGYWLVKGYCYYHNDERLFNPRRMSDMKVL